MMFPTPVFVWESCFVDDDAKDTIRRSSFDRVSGVIGAADAPRAATTAQSSYLRSLRRSNQIKPNCGTRTEHMRNVSFSFSFSSCQDDDDDDDNNNMDRYELGESIGEGAFGIVFLAHKKGTQIKVGVFGSSCCDPRFLTPRSTPISRNATHEWKTNILY
jgi:hypothetical protein